MFLRLIQFEWLFWLKKISFYLMLGGYLALGFAIATSARFPFPETNKNSPYINTYIIGILSLIAIFSTTMMAAQSLFREQDTRFDTLLYATPLRKLPYVASRFLIIFLVNTMGFALLTTGLLAGHLLADTTRDAYGPVHGSYYLQPFLVLLLPNILFCTSVACCIGLCIRNKMTVYIAGVFLYFLYWGIAIFTDSPLIANAAPASAAALRYAALSDPFGIAAFLEQTRYWLPAERNTQLLQLKGNFLSNRIGYLAVSSALLLVAYTRFRFRLYHPQQRQEKAAPTTLRQPGVYAAVAVQPAGLRYAALVLQTQLRTTWSGIAGSPALWIACLGWAGFLAIELMSRTGGSSRMPPMLATTAVMTAEIRASLPLVGYLLLLFYGGEAYRRNRDVRFAPFEDSTPAPPGITLLAKCLALTGVIVLLLLFSILTGITVQCLRGYTHMDWTLYASLFYLTGVPLALNAMLILSLQAWCNNKYMAMAIGGIVLLLLHTAAGSTLLPHHPLLQYGKAFNGGYSDMNDFGNALQAFGTQTLYGLGLCGMLLSLALLMARRRQRWGGNGLKAWYVPVCLLLLSLPLAIAGGYVLQKYTRIDNRDEQNDRRQAFEMRYGFLKNKAQPLIVNLRTTIDLYPGTESAVIAGVYTMTNPGKVAIDTLYIRISDQMRCLSLSVPGAALHNRDTVAGYSVFVWRHPMLPGDTTQLHFRLQYTASPFRKADGANQILANGTFSRISQYYPVPGYDNGQEIDDPRERARRKMPASTNMLLLSDRRDSTGGQFVNIQTLISTDATQTAIAVGTLRKQWQQQNRNYFYYTTEQPVPFRFAIASARYAVKRLRYGGVTIEAYYHPAHARNIDHLLEVAKQTLAYCTSNFGPYPGKRLCLAEISSFSSGFAGTAYPGCLFINESFGFKHIINGEAGRDIINEMASHELSHTWWGNAGIAPGHREGSKLLTETLAMYTELMLYKRMYGEGPLAARVAVHKDLYFSGRGMEKEAPLYKAAPEMAYLCYDKGMVAMYQLYKRLGERRMNQALRSFYEAYAYPHPEPRSEDLIDALYTVADSSQHQKIDELLRRIVIYHFRIGKAALSRVAGQYLLRAEATVDPYEEDGEGGQRLLSFHEPVPVGVYFEDGSCHILQLRPQHNKILIQQAFAKQPAKIVLDPEGLYLDQSGEHKERTLTLLR